MSSCSRAVAALGALVALGVARPAVALNVLGVYRAACDRDMGVVVRVEKRDLHLLDLSGKLVTIPRHEIVSLAYYPVSSLPLQQIELGGKLPAFQVSALQSKSVVELVEGWPIDYSEEKVAFLQRDGKELVINRDSIWSLRLVVRPGQAAAAVAAKDDSHYAHPQASGFCTADAPAEGVRRIFPQQFLNDEVVIKRELDRLQEGFERIEKYGQDQLFYALPEVYRNQTSLGLWLSLGSRHGATSRRTNYTPLLVDELSLGPFSYQHVIVTGSAPNRLLVHEEAQTQVFYAFKAAYFHASVFFDPNLVLVGDKYWWREDDFAGDRLGDRWIETFLVELGFDLGGFSLQFVPVSAGQVGMGGRGVFHASHENLWRLGPRIVSRFFQADLTGGRSPGEDRFWYFRANLEVPVRRGMVLAWSGIMRTAHAKFGVADDRGYYQEQLYDARTIVNALRLRALIGPRAAVEGQLSLEQVRASLASVPGEDSSTHVKGAVYGSFRF